MVFAIVTTYLRVKGLIDEDAMMMLFLLAFIEIVFELFISIPILATVL